MKQKSRADKVIEAIKLFRILCSQQTQESLDDVLIDLYKRAGRIDEHIELLQHKLQLVEDGATYGGQRTKTVRAQGKKYLCSIEHEKSRKALSIEPDKNKHCNLAICLMHKGRITEAKSLLLTVEPPPSVAERELADSCVNSFRRATEMLSELDSGPLLKPLEQKKNDSIKMVTQGSITALDKVNSSSPVSSITEVHQNSHSRLSPISGHHQNQGFGGKWRAHDSHLSVSPTNGADSDFGNWKPFGSSKSRKNWTDMMEEQEEKERLSRFTSDYTANMVDSVCGWSSEGSNYMSQQTPARLLVDECYDKNEAVYSNDDDMNSIASCHQLPSVNATEYNLQGMFETVAINGEFRKPAARGSLYFDQKQEQKPSVQKSLYSNTHECAGNPSIFSGNDGFGGKSREEDLNEEDFSGTEVNFPYDMDRFGEILRNEQDYASSVTAGVIKKRGTVVILYPYRDETFVASDSRLNKKNEDYRDKKKDQNVKEDEEKETEENPKEDEGTDIEKQENRLKGKDVADEDKKYIICYKQANKDIRCNIEEVGQKILTCERFAVALAGNYTLAHPICTGLIEKCRKGEKVSDCSLLEPLQKHCKEDKDKQTDFVLLTPSDERGRDFDIRYVTHDGTYPVDDLLCFGSGGELAKEFIKKYTRKFKPKSKSEIIEMLKQAVYHVSGEGGTVVVTAAKIEKCGMKKKLVTEILKFPSTKPMWNWSISNRLDNLNFPSKYLMAAGEKVLDMDIMKKIMLGELDENVIGQNLVRARIYTVGIGRSFYQTSRYMMDCEDCHDYSLYLRYNQDQDKFTLGPTPDDDNDSENVYFVDDFRRLQELIIGREYMYWDNEKAVFVIC